MNRMTSMLVSAGVMLGGSLLSAGDWKGLSGDVAAGFDAELQECLLHPVCGDSLPDATPVRHAPAGQEGKAGPGGYGRALVPQRWTDSLFLKRNKSSNDIFALKLAKLPAMLLSGRSVPSFLTSLLFGACPSVERRLRSRTEFACSRYSVQTSVAHDAALDPKLLTVFIVGDSTARNQADLGWGDHFADLFDTSRINSGQSSTSRTEQPGYVNEGLWEHVLSEMKPGDLCPYPDGTQRRQQSAERSQGSPERQRDR